MTLDLLAADARVLVREPGPRIGEFVHALLDRGARVDLHAAHGADPTCDDLASRRLVTLVAEPELTAYDLVVRDRTGQQPAATAGHHGGRVILVGGGPGEPGLLTVAGLAALRAADVVVTDRLAPLGILDDLPNRPEVIHVGKIPRGAFTPQERINAILLEHAQAGRTVVRLKGGDSFVFGRGGEEWNACQQAAVPVEVIPGVSSSVAVPALAGIPVTHRGVSQGFVVVSGHVAPADERSDVDWDALARCGLTLVLLMGVAALPQIAEALVAAGMDPGTPAACIADGAMTSQREVVATVSTLAAAVAHADLRPPCVTVIGPVVTALAHEHGGARR